MVKAVNIVNVFNSLSIDKIFKMVSNTARTDTTSLNRIGITHIRWNTGIVP